jgi:hypothetical protein
MIEATKTLMTAVAKALPIIAWDLIMVRLLQIFLFKQCESARPDLEDSQLP